MKHQGSKNRSPRRHLATCSAALATRKKSRSPSDPGFSAERVLPAFCRLAFDFSGFDENLVAFCRLECFAGFPFLPANGHSASLKLNQRDETFSFPSYFLLNRATGDPRVASNAPLEPHARQATVLFRYASFGRSVTTDRETKAAPSLSNHVQVTQNAPRHFRYAVSVLHALAISQLVDEWLANCKHARRHRSWTLPKCKNGRRFVDREIKKILQTLRSQVLSSS